jgi:hypothetical protein
MDNETNQNLNPNLNLNQNMPPKRKFLIIISSIILLIIIGACSFSFVSPLIKSNTEKNNIVSNKEATSTNSIPIGDVWTAPSVVSETTGVIKSLRIIAAGVILKDDFNDKTLDFNKWKKWELGSFITQDWISLSGKAMRLAGHLVGPQNSNLANTSSSYIGLGLVSQRYPTNDVVLVGRMKAVLMPKLQSGKYLYAVLHICNTFPDFFSEIRFGNLPNGEFGWVFLSRDEKETSSEVIPAFGNEATSFYTVKLEHNGLTNKTSGYIERDNKWIKVGEANNTHRFATQVELKDVGYADGVDIDTRFDDIRLYPYPDNTPVHFILTGPSPYFTYPVSNSDSLSLKLFQSNGTTLIGEGKNTGEGAFEVKLSRDFIFPISGVIKIYNNGKETGSAKNTANGVDGLYPGDIWSVNINTGSSTTPSQDLEKCMQDCMKGGKQQKKCESECGAPPSQQQLQINK